MFIFTPLDQLLAVLGALYLLECLAWLRWGTLVCVRFFPLPRRVLRALEFPANGSGGLGFTGFWPSDVGWLAPALPLAMSPDGVVGEPVDHPHPGHRTAGSGCVLTWEEMLGTRAHDGEVRVGNRALAAHLAPETARQTAVLLRRLAACPSAARGAAITRHLSRTLRAKEATRRSRRWLKGSLSMRVNALCAFFLLFAVVPACEHLSGLGAVQWVLLGFALLWLHVLTVVELVLLHRAHFPAQRLERLKCVALAAMAPTIAMRAGQTGARNVMAGLHPLAVAAGTGAPGAWCPLFAPAWRDAHHPLPPESSDSRAKAILVWHRQAWCQTLASFAKERGVALPAAGEGLGPVSTETRSFCPRCLALYAKYPAQCAACENMPTQVLPKA